MTGAAELLDELTVEGELYEALPDNAVRCYACGHRCLIRDGRRGICQVRYNQGGKLRVPWGYVAALQVDPIEKKPFFHLFPGSDVLTFGMLGCDFHCGYCFTGETVVVTNNGPISLAEAFSLGENVKRTADAEISFPTGLRAITSSGKSRSVKAVFKHDYRGKIVEVRPYYLPTLRCTPDHRFYATKEPSTPPQLIPAAQLSKAHYLVIPRCFYHSQSQVIDVAKELSEIVVEYRVRWDLPRADRETVASMTARGASSRQIGATLGKDPSYIRHVRSKLAHGLGTDIRSGSALLDKNTLRFPNEHRPGIPQEIALDENMARLLGYYCAEGSAVRSRARPNSWALNFSFSPGEQQLAEEVKRLIHQCLNVHARYVSRETSLCVTTGKASAALLFKTLAGGKAPEKHVPQMIFDSPAPVMRAFLQAYSEGDGHRFANGKVSTTTVSTQMAYGVAWLALKLGYLPSIYDSQISPEGQIQGRQVQRSPHQYSVVWYEESLVKRKVIATDDYYLIPLRGLDTVDFSGDVYNMEVEEEHNYLAGFFLVSNCQNWLTSQALKDPAAAGSIGYVSRVSPQQMVAIAQRSGADIIASSYNEPLITSEWAVGIFKEAKAAGLKCAYISNGNATAEALEYLRPYLSAYKIDLKTMQDSHYRQLGGVLAHVLESIQQAHDLGLWVEVVTLVVPGFNDSTEELMDAARFIASVSTDIPWHVTAFHPDYKMTDPPPTSVRTLLRAAEIGQEAGLSYVYAGNIPGRLGEYERTVCPNCQSVLIERTGYVIYNYRITAQGTCPRCNQKIAGVWSEHPERVRTGGPGMPRLVSR
jgi:pyruvate formate lyase activating enzyme